MLRKTYINYGEVSATSIRVPHFDTAINTPMDSAFGIALIEETSAGHFYSDTQTMPADRAPMIDMCRTEDHENFSDHIIATHLGEFGEVDD